MTKHCTACGIELPPRWRGPRLCEMCRSLDDISNATDSIPMESLEQMRDRERAALALFFEAWLRIREGK